MTGGVEKRYFLNMGVWPSGTAADFDSAIAGSIPATPATGRAETAGVVMRSLLSCNGPGVEVMGCASETMWIGANLFKKGKNNMLEMTWNREEALKRLACVFQETEGSVDRLAAIAAKAPSKRMQEEMFWDACEKKEILVGISVAAEALGIATDELRTFEVDEEEKNEFMKALVEQKEAEMKEEYGSDLKDLLQQIFS